MIEKPKLFNTGKEFVIFTILMLGVVATRLGWEYREFKAFVSKPFYYTYATVVNTYPKQRNGKKYTILKLRTKEGKTVYTTTYRKDDLAGKDLYLQLIPGRQIGFWDYLGGMYCKSRIKKIINKKDNISSILGRLIAAEHSNPQIKSFYKAVFVASPVPKELREQIASLGASHLVALSGFHLGILWGVLYTVLLLIYKPLQQRYFPYRYSLSDVGAVVMLVLALYLWLTAFPPSLLRSYAMLLAGWVMVLMGIELVSFTFLFTIALLLLALLPSLTVSLSFWLSVAGVFYIFLLLQYCQKYNKWLITLLCIPVGIFVLMQPVAHYFFALTTPYQLLSPLLSLVFVVFYPFSILLHLIGQGDLLDGGLKWLFDLPMHTDAGEHLMPLWGLAAYLLLSFWAIWSKRAFFALVAISVIYTAAVMQ